MTDSVLAQIDACLARLAAADEATAARVREELVVIAFSHYRKLATLMLNDFPDLRKWTESGDIHADAMIRLRRALATDVPNDRPHFLALVRLQIRRELLDLKESAAVRRWKAFVVAQSASQSPEAYVPDSAGADPGRVNEWNEFLAQIDGLPATEKAVFERIYYGGMTQKQAAADLGKTEHHVRMWLKSAQRRLSRKFLAFVPTEDAE